MGGQPHQIRERVPPALIRGPQVEHLLPGDLVTVGSRRGVGVDERGQLGPGHGVGGPTEAIADPVAVCSHPERRPGDSVPLIGQDPVRVHDMAQMHPELADISGVELGTLLQEPVLGAGVQVVALDQRTR